MAVRLAALHTAALYSQKNIIFLLEVKWNPGPSVAEWIR
jgi:hypothetical protein